MDTPDRARLQAIAQWIQREDEALLYTPDGGDVALGRGIGCYLLEGRIPVPACNSQSQTFEPVFAARPGACAPERAACGLPGGLAGLADGRTAGRWLPWRGVGAKMGARRRWKRPFDFPILFAHEAAADVSAASLSNLAPGASGVGTPRRGHTRCRRCASALCRDTTG